MNLNDYLPIYDGGWKIGDSWTIYVKSKPTDQQIKNTEELLGWVWVEVSRGEE